MNKPLIVACVQNCAGQDMDANLTQCSALVREAHAQGAQLVCLPEYFSCLNVSRTEFEVGPWAEEDHPALAHYQNLARKLGIWMQLGSLAIKAGASKIFNRSYLIDHTGTVTAHYDKLHLFDVDLPDGMSYRESDIVEPGDRAVVAATPWGPIGLSVCYDLRFPYLYRALAQAGAIYLTVPAAFTKTTGQAHWHVLLRARAIETGCYVFAACQYGRHGEAKTYGHSLIVDPWGAVLADGGDGPGFITAEVNPNKAAEARQSIPALQHDRNFTGPHHSPTALSSTERKVG